MNLISMNISLHYAGEPPEYNCSSNSCAFYGLSTAKVNYECFIFSQFGYCPLVWLFHCRKLNNRMSNIHERALRTVFKDWDCISKKAIDTCYQLQRDSNPQPLSS